MILTYRHAAHLAELNPHVAMAAIACCAQPVDADFWPALASQVRAAWQQQGVQPHDAVVLLPYANLLPIARLAFAQTPGWQPRIETLQTLADALGPPPAWQPGQVSGDARIDLLEAQRLLTDADQSLWAPTLATLAQQLHQASAAWPPDERGARWQRLREALPPLATGLPGGIERSLLRAAMAWAAIGEPAPGDALWRHKPSAWVAVVAGGRQAGVQALLQAAAAQGVPVLEVITDPSADARFAACLPPRVLVCNDAAQEAREAAWQVMQALHENHKPVALVAHDRQLVRRVHAVLVQRGVRVHDDTGWALSTTHAAARAMAVLRAVSQPASRDAQLDAMKALGWAGDELLALDALERAWRLDRPISASAAALAQRWQVLCAGLADARPQALSRWLALLAERFAPLWSSLVADPAGRAVLDALHLDGKPTVQEAAWQRALAQPLSWLGFMGWVEQALEQGSFMPSPPADAEVVITPLARTALRPFTAVVFPGCDERFGAPSARPAPWPEALAREYGLPHEAERREREGLAFAQLLRQSRVVLLRRASEAGEPLAASLWLQRAQWALPAWQEEMAPQRHQALAAQPALPPQPRLATALPARLSASTVEALRACPYRFFSRAVLRLGEATELDTDWQKRDHGDWLHRVLHRFHADRPAPRSADDDLAALRNAAQNETDALARDAADLLPFEAGFAAFATHYIGWLHQRDAQGWRYAEGEAAREKLLPGLDPPVQLVGRIDRIDTAPDGSRQLIDYKTGNLKDLEQRVREPLEDTQLAVYAALADARDLQACYLALDDRKPPKEVMHAEVDHSAQTLLRELPRELQALRDGAAMPALGEGRVCDTCEARGLCRRDDWKPLS